MQFVLFWLSSTRVHAFRGTDGDLPSDQNKLLGDFGNTRKKVLDLLTRCEHVEKTQRYGMMCEITEVCSELERLERVCRDQKQAIAYKMDKASEQLRKQYMSRRWQIQKVSQKLVTGGFSQKHSTFFGESMFNIAEKEPDDGTPIGADVSGLDEDRALVDAREETFDFKKIVVWNANVRGKPLQDLMHRNSKKVASKVAAQDKKMQENPAWVGAMGVVSDFECGEMSTFMQSTLRGLAMPGARAWLVTVTDGAHRSTPTGVPLAGVGCVLVPLSDAPFVHGCSMRHVLDDGIAMANYDSSWPRSKAIGTSRTRHGWLRVPKDGMLSVSPGSCYCVVYWSKDKACKEKFKKEANVAPCAHCFHVPLASTLGKHTSAKLNCGPCPR